MKFQIFCFQLYNSYQANYQQPFLRNFRQTLSPKIILYFSKIHDIFLLYFYLILHPKTHFIRKDFYIHGLLQTCLHHLPKHPIRYRRHLRSDCPPMPEAKELPPGRLRPPHRKTRQKYPRPPNPECLRHPKRRRIFRNLRPTENSPRKRRRNCHPHRQRLENQPQEIPMENHPQ